MTAAFRSDQLAGVSDTNMATKYAFRGLGGMSIATKLLVYLRPPPDLSEILQSAGK